MSHRGMNSFGVAGVIDTSQHVSLEPAEFMGSTIGTSTHHAHGTIHNASRCFNTLVFHAREQPEPVIGGTSPRIHDHRISLELGAKRIKSYRHIGYLPANIRVIAVVCEGVKGGAFVPCALHCQL
jgi:hypothetical protein